MKKPLLAVCVGILAVLSSLVVVRLHKAHRVIAASVREAPRPRPEFPRWTPHRTVVQGRVSDRLELYEKSGECGYIEKWSSQEPALFMVFLIPKPDSAERDMALVSKNVEFVDGYDNLDSAKSATENLCRDR